MSKQLKRSAQQGFTLVELSIVLIIIGFLIAGIAAGSSMIKSAEINSVITDFQRNQSAYNNFIGRYSQAPGDFNNGSAIWGTNCATTATNCNGNANGIIDSATEVQAAWKQMALAGMISSSIAIVPNTAAAATPGTNVPLSKVLGAGYDLVNGGTSVNGFARGLWGATTNSNIVLLGKPGAGNSTGVNAQLLNSSAYSAENAYSIDTKVDDGNPTTGTIRSIEGLDAAANGCVDTNGNYALATSGVSCVVAMAVN